MLVLGTFRMAVAKRSPSAVSRPSAICMGHAVLRSCDCQRNDPEDEIKSVLSKEAAAFLYTGPIGEKSLDASLISREE